MELDLQVDDGVADQRLVVFDHTRDLAQGLRRAFDDHLPEILRRRDRQQMLDREPLRGGLDPAARARSRGVERGERRRPEGIAGRVDDRS